MASFTYVKGPSEFQYGDDFEIFWDRFTAFSLTAKLEEKAMFSLFLSYLDDVSFRRVKTIVFGAEHKSGDGADAYVDYDNINDRPNLVTSDQFVKASPSWNPFQNISGQEKIDYNNDGKVNWAGFFGQLE